MTTTQPRPAANPPIGRTVLGTRVWAIPAQPGRHLIWDGPGARVEITRQTQPKRDGSVTVGGSLGAIAETPCHDLIDAQLVVDHWLAGAGTC